MDDKNSVSNLALLGLIEPIRWQRLQDHFARVLGVMIRSISPSRALLVNPSWPASLASEQTISLLKIGEELESLVPLNNPPQQISSLTTNLGITYAVVPIRVISEQVIAYFVVGPMVVGLREDELQFSQRVSAIGLDPRPLWALILSLKLYTFAGVRSALSLMEEVGGALVQLAYQAKQLETILPATNRVEKVLVSYQTDRVLNALLDVATLATKAEGGSVMMFEIGTDTLKIKAAQGLSEEVVNKTSLKRGEGIAGLAVAQRSIFLIDDQAGDSRFKDRMRRKELISSIVAPLIPNSTQDPVGVLNLRTSSQQNRFTKEHVELLRRLLDLAGAALGSLHFAFNQA